jgi:subfamily B ATP-binding cassette protein MsbA
MILSLTAYVSCWGDETLMERIKYVVKQACISEYIETLENRCNTVVGDRSIRLSGGQRQGLFIV